MKSAKLLFLAVLFAVAAPLWAQYDYNGGQSPDGDPMWIKTGTPCELGTMMDLGDLDPGWHFVVAKGVNPSTGTVVEFNYPGQTNFDCHDGRGIRATKPGKKLHWGEVLAARWDPNTCAWDYTLMYIKKCGKGHRQYFKPAAILPLELAPEDGNRPLECNRAQQTAAAIPTSAAPQLTGQFSVETLQPDNIGKVDATLHGSLISQQTAAFDCRFVWGKVPRNRRGNATIGDLRSYTGPQLMYSYGHGGFFEYNLENLDMNETYAFAAACKQDGLGDVRYGDIVEFDLAHVGWIERHPVATGLIVTAAIYTADQAIHGNLHLPFRHRKTTQQPPPPQKQPCFGRCAPADQHPQGPPWTGNPPGCTTCGTQPQQPGPTWPGNTTPPAPTQPGPGPTWPGNLPTNPTPGAPTPGGTWPGNPTPQPPPPPSNSGPGIPWGGH